MHISSNVNQPRQRTSGAIEVPQFANDPIDFKSCVGTRMWGPSSRDPSALASNTMERDGRRESMPTSRLEPGGSKIEQGRAMAAEFTKNLPAQPWRGEGYGHASCTGLVLKPESLPAWKIKGRSLGVLLGPYEYFKKAPPFPWTSLSWLPPTHRPNFEQQPRFSTSSPPSIPIRKHNGSHPPGSRRLPVSRGPLRGPEGPTHRVCGHEERRKLICPKQLRPRQCGLDLLCQHLPCHGREQAPSHQRRPVPQRLWQR